MSARDLRVLEKAIERLLIEWEGRAAIAEAFDGHGVARSRNGEANLVKTEWRMLRSCANQLRDRTRKPEAASEEPDELTAQMLPCPGCGNAEDLYLDLWGYCSECGTASAHKHTREESLEGWNRVAKAVMK